MTLFDTVTQLTNYNQNDFIKLMRRPFSCASAVRTRGYFSPYQLAIWFCIAFRCYWQRRVPVGNDFAEWSEWQRYCHVLCREEGVCSAVRVCEVGVVVVWCVWMKFIVGSFVSGWRAKGKWENGWL